VSFRFFARDTAAELDLTGWVANRYDGSVEVVSEGPRSALDRLLEFLLQGPPMARVDQVQHEFSPATGEFKRFTIELG
jgi:acylphosphatase